MTKMIRSFAMLMGVIAASWWLGGMMYFIMVTKHFRDKENYEDLSKNILSYINGTSGRTTNGRSNIRVGETKTNPGQHAPRPIR